MALTVTVTPGKQFAVTETITNAKLNQLGQPTFTVTGTVATSDITNNSVTSDKTIAGAHFYTSSVSFNAGTGDYTLTLPGSPSVADGMVVAFKANANGVPAVNGIRLVVGASTVELFKNKTERLVAGDIVTNQIVEARYVSTGWQMTSQLAQLPNTYTATVGGTGNAITLTVTPPASYPLTLADLVGRRISFKVALVNTGPVTLTVTIGGASMGVKPLKRNSDVALTANDLKVNQVVDVAYEATSDTFQMLSQVGNPAGETSPTASSRNLVFVNPNLTAATLTADEVVFAQISGTGRVLRSGISVGITVNTGVGLNGYETGAARTLNTWYYVWLIYNPTTFAIATVLESAGAGDGAAPGGPDLSNVAFAGYTYQALVGHLRLNGIGAGEIVPFRQFGRQVWTVEQVVFNNKAPLVANTWAVLAALDLTAFRAAVPPDAASCSGFAGSSNVTDAVAIMLAGCTAGGGLDVSWHLGAQLINQFATAAFASGADPGPTNSWGVACPFTLPVNPGVARNFMWKGRLVAQAVSLSISCYTF